MRRFVVLSSALLLFSAAHGQTLTGIQLEPQSAKVGEPVRITVSFSNAESPNCNVRLHFGDGTNRDHKVNQAKDVPLVRSHTYTKPGSYTVKAEGKTALPMLKCVGATQSALLQVAAEGPAAPQCPPGWTLDAKSVGKRGAFTCHAKAGSAPPAARLACPSPLRYFENASRGQLGCRP
jgi:PKD domain